MIEGLPAKVQSLEVEGLNLDKLIHQLNGRLELVDLDVTARAEEVAVLYYVEDDFVLMSQLGIEVLDLEHLDCLVEQGQAVKVVLLEV